ncbi:MULTISPECIES: DUF4190 domain-containing protein [unclassified Streptomyces]|uniref:DUF4190 domain-containing protein n=1 Tax=unclassified Streptomyces TaxID=2593676 RepID=UPI002E0EFE44|nr:DUF4190 domain-containing protein [Streptomyces sp. NBC_01320]
MADESGTAGGQNLGVPPGTAPGYGVAQAPYGYGYPTGAALPTGKATASMVLGIVGLLLIPIVAPIIALCLGISARRMADRGEGGARGQATAGMVMGIIGCAFACLGFLVATIQAVSGV